MTTTNRKKFLTLQADLLSAKISLAHAEIAQWNQQRVAPNEQIQGIEDAEENDQLAKDGAPFRVNQRVRVKAGQKAQEKKDPGYSNGFEDGEEIVLAGRRAYYSAIGVFVWSAMDLDSTQAGGIREDYLEPILDV